jgi:hypothetical protein
MEKKRVVVTGATGVIASKLLPDLGERYELVLVDKKNTNPSGAAVDGVVSADLLDRDRSHYREIFADAHAVIHSGFVRSEDPEHRFWAELDNVAMAYNVYQACVEANVRRAVVISSNHAADFYEQLILDGSLLSIGPETPPRSDNFYGWAKIAYEALGFVFACGRINDGRPLGNVQVRIGAPRETDIEGANEGDVKKMRRDLGAYISLRDEVQLITRSIEAETIDDEWGIPFQIVYGVSGNTCNFWSIENARRVLGYEPEDDAMNRFADHVGRILGLSPSE